MHFIFRKNANILYFDFCRLIIVCKPQYSNIDGSIEALTFKVEPILCEDKDKTRQERQKMDNGKFCTFNYATKSDGTQGSFRFETAEEVVQITAIDGSGTTHSQLLKDGNPREFGICDAENVTFQMKGLSQPNFEVTLLYKILHFTEDWKLKLKTYIFLRKNKGTYFPYSHMDNFWLVTKTALLKKLRLMINEIFDNAFTKLAYFRR